MAACQLNYPTHKLTVIRKGIDPSEADGSGIQQETQNSHITVVSDSESDPDYDMMCDDQDMEIPLDTGATTTNQRALLSMYQYIYVVNCACLGI